MAAAPLRSEPTPRSAVGGLDPSAACGANSRSSSSNPGLVFLDSGASAQKPRQVIDGIAEFYRTDYANVHRGVYRLSARSTDRFEEAREKVRALPQRRRRARDRLRARRHRGDQPRRAELGPGQPQSRRRDRHQRCRAPLEHRAVADVARPARRSSWSSRRPTPPASSTWRAFEALLSPRTRLVAVTHVSNVTGATLAGRAHRRAGACEAAPRC